MLPIGCVCFTNTGVFADTHPRNQSKRLCVMFSVFVDGDGHERGPTSRHIVGTKIQSDGNFEAHYTILAIVWILCIVSGLCLDANYR